MSFMSLDGKDLEEVEKRRDKERAAARATTAKFKGRPPST